MNDSGNEGARGGAAADGDAMMAKKNEQQQQTAESKDTIITTTVTAASDDVDGNNAFAQQQAEGVTFRSERTRRQVGSSTSAAEQQDVLLLDPLLPAPQQQQQQDEDERSTTSYSHGRVQPPAFRDAWCAALFYAQFLAMLVAAISLGPLILMEQENKQQPEANTTTTPMLLLDGLRQLLQLCGKYPNDYEDLIIRELPSSSSGLIMWWRAALLLVLVLLIPAVVAMMSVVAFYTMLVRYNEDCHKFVSWSFYITPILYWTAAVALFLFQHTTTARVTSHVLGLASVGAAWTVAAFVHRCWYRRSIPFTAANLQVAVQALTAASNTTGGVDATPGETAATAPTSAASNENVNSTSTNNQTQLRLPQPLTQLVLLSLSAQAVLVLYGGMAVVALAGIMAYYQQMAVPCDDDGDQDICYGSTPSPMIYLLWALCVFWTHSVVHNVLRTTTAGTVGSWWFPTTAVTTSTTTRSTDDVALSAMASSVGAGQDEEEGVSLMATHVLAAENDSSPGLQEALLSADATNGAINSSSATPEEVGVVEEPASSSCSSCCCSCCYHADVCDSLYRSMTFSFGSICFGSLLVALVQAVHLLLGRVMMRRRHGGSRRGEREGSLLFCCCDGLLQLLARMVDFFNAWSFTYVGLYGYDYLTAGRKVSLLWQVRGWSSVITDRLMYRVLTYAKWGVGAIAGSLCFVLAQLVQHLLVSGDMATGLNQATTVTTSLDRSTTDDAISLLFSGEVSLTIGLIGALMGVVLADVSFRVVESAVRTLLVCLAETAPEQAAVWHPVAHSCLAAGWQHSYPDEWQRQHEEQHHQYILIDDS